MASEIIATHNKASNIGSRVANLSNANAAITIINASEPKALPRRSCWNSLPKAPGACSNECHQQPKNSELSTVVNQLPTNVPQFVAANISLIAVSSIL